MTFDVATALVGSKFISEAFYVLVIMRLESSLKINRTSPATAVALVRHLTQLLEMF